MTDATQTVFLPDSYTLHRGGCLAKVAVAYETWGELNAEKDNVVLILTGLSPDAHAASSDRCPRVGWWEFMIGADKPIDTDRFHVICVNSLGSCKGTTGPASINAATGHAYGPDFPMLSIEDIACTAKLALQELGIERVHTLIGPSMGGMSVLAYALLYPDRVDNFVMISASPRAEAFAIGLRSVQREAIRSDANWNGGWYHDGPYPMAGIRLARKLGVITYRSPAEWRARFGRKKVDELRRMQLAVELEFEVESYLEAHAQRFVGSFDPNCYLALSHAMDLFDVDDFGEDAADAYSLIQAQKALVIGTESDILFPAHQQRELAKGLSGAGIDVTCHIMDSIQGHDAFLVDKARFGPAVRDFLAALPD